MCCVAVKNTRDSNARVPLHLRAQAYSNTENKLQLVQKQKQKQNKKTQHDLKLEVYNFRILPWIARKFLFF